MGNSETAEKIFHLICKFLSDAIDPSSEHCCHSTQIYSAFHNGALFARCCNYTGPPQIL